MKGSGFGRFALCIAGAAASLVGCGGSQLPVGNGGVTDHAAQADVSLPYNHTFNYTGKGQSFVVPAGVTSITVVARGAAGGGSFNLPRPQRTGGRVYAVLPVYPGEKLHVFVGGSGFGSSVRLGGFNGGGNPGRCCEGGFGGGGASDVRQGGAKLRDRILVAGGGGGMGGFTCCGGSGGIGGGLIGGPGSGGEYSESAGGGGGGGAQSSGGSGGAGGKREGEERYNGRRGKSGDFGVGGKGGLSGFGTDSSLGGAGGGGGYYGGGGGGGGYGGIYGQGGAPGGGGGGGSSYVEPSAISFRTWPGWKKATGNGLVVFSWQ